MLYVELRVIWEPGTEVYIKSEKRVGIVKYVGYSLPDEDSISYFVEYEDEDGDICSSFFAENDLDYVTVLDTDEEEEFCEVCGRMLNEAGEEEDLDEDLDNEDEEEEDGDETQPSVEEHIKKSRIYILRIN